MARIALLMAARPIRSREDTIDTDGTNRPIPRHNTDGRTGGLDATARAVGRDAVLDPEKTSSALEQLRAIVADLGSCVLALSGGLDSTVLLEVAARELGERCLAVTAESPSLPSWDRRDAADAQARAQALGARTRTIATNEFDDPRYARNQRLRCFYCKTALFEALSSVAAAEGFRWVVDGTNADDLAATDRPGLLAASNLGTRSPLAEAGLRKSDVRELARLLGLPDPDRPASACLASRIPFGSPITVERLRRVESAEERVRALGFRQVRVRDIGDGLARVEVDEADLGYLHRTADAVASVIASAGFDGFETAAYRGGGAGLARQPQSQA